MKLQEIRLEHLQSSPTNPRKSFPAAMIADLASSIGQHGVLQPILVRPIATIAAPPGSKIEPETRYEVVCGECRFRAARAAGLEAIPASVRQLDDDQVLEIQLVENLSRSDLDPIEEAYGYERLRAHGFSIRKIAEKVSKSANYVYQRLRLSELPQEIKDAVTDGILTTPMALLIATIPMESMQIEALDDLTTNRPAWRSGPVTVEDVKEVVAGYQTNMANAQWDLADASLIEDAGPCTTCSKRTGGACQLFPGLETEDVCLDAVCFAGKSEAHWNRVRIEALAAGKKVATEKQTEKIFGGGNYLVHGSGFINLESKCYFAEGGERSYGELLEGSDVGVTVARAANGTIVELVDAEEARRFIEKTLKIKSRVRDQSPKEPKKPTAKQAAAEREAAIQAKADQMAVNIACEEITQKARESAPDVAFWRALALSMLPTALLYMDTCDRHFDGEEDRAKVAEMIDGMTAFNARAVVVRFILERERNLNGAVAKFAEVYGVNLDECRRIGRKNAEMSMPEVKPKRGSRAKTAASAAADASEEK